MDPARTTATTDAQNAAKATACNAFFCLSSSEKSGDLKKTVQYCPIMIQPSRISRAKMVAIINRERIKTLVKTIGK